MTPGTEADLAELIAGANGPFDIRGGGTRGVPGAGTVLTTTGLSGIELYEPGALTIVARAGTPLSEVEHALAAENQRLAFEPADYRGLLGRTGAPTIGGIVAANASGPRRIQAGACRDFLLGVRFVDGSGTIVKNGGRVMKNVTGYDLAKLLAGSWGRLGVLTEVGLKVLPRAETQATLILPSTDIAQAVAVLSKGLGSPFEVTGAAFDPAGDVAGRPAALLRIEGFAEAVAYRTDALAKLLAPLGEVEVLDNPDRSDAIWRAIRDVAPFHDVPGDVWRISCRPGDAPALAGRLRAEGLLFDWGGGLIWARVPPGSDLRARLGDFDGHATLIRADSATRARLGTFHPEPAAVAALAEGLRARFDPRGLFNPALARRVVEA